MDILEQIYNEGELFILFSSPDCERCKVTTHILDVIPVHMKDKLVKVNPKDLSDEDKNTLIHNQHSFEEVKIPMPFLIRCTISKNHSIKTDTFGLIERKNYAIAVEWVKTFSHMNYMNGFIGC